MKPNKLLTIALLTLLTLSLFLTGCGDESYYEDEYYEDEGYEDEYYEDEGYEDEDYEEEENDEDYEDESYEEDDVEELSADEIGTDEQVSETSAQPRETGGDADSGFTPHADGFSFYNYGNEYTNLTPAELQRMFGDTVCANIAGGECNLTPPARQWMNQMNKYMDGGHCEGMAVLSSLMFYDQVSPTDFGGTTAYDLDIDGNEALQREIAYWWVTQGTYPGGYNKISDSPSEVLDTLITTFNEGIQADEWWALGIYKSDFTGGHAITPFAVEDKGNGIFHILVYDNNYPNETRFVEVDRNNDTWWYEGSPNPDISEDRYDGDAELDNLEIVSISPRLGQQSCEFCDARDPNKTPGLALMRPGAPTQDYYEVWLQGKADLLIVTDDGRRLGFVEGELVNEIDGATSQDYRFADTWEGQYEPVYHIPLNVTFDITVDGSRLQEAESSEVTLIGPGYFMSVDDLWLEPNETDTIGVFVDEQRHQLTYVTDYAESPVIRLGLETEEADYALMIQATEITGMEDNFDVGIDLEIGDFIINTSYNEKPITFDFTILSIDDEGEHVFGADDLVMEPDDTAYLNYRDLRADSTVIFLELDYGNDGEIDESFELPDEADIFYWDEITE